MYQRQRDGPGKQTRDNKHHAQFLVSELDLGKLQGGQKQRENRRRHHDASRQAEKTILQPWRQLADEKHAHTADSRSQGRHHAGACTDQNEVGRIQYPSAAAIDCARDLRAEAGDATSQAPEAAPTGPDFATSDPSRRTEQTGAPDPSESDPALRGARRARNAYRASLGEGRGVAGSNDRPRGKIYTPFNIIYIMRTFAEMRDPERGQQKRPKALAGILIRSEWAKNLDLRLIRLVEIHCRLLFLSSSWAVSRRL